MLTAPASDTAVTADIRATAAVEQLTHLATTVLNEHTNNAGLCATCGSAFPCPSAVLAEHNAALR
jgi:hypothetical protein